MTTAACTDRDLSPADALMVVAFAVAADLAGQRPDHDKVVAWLSLHCGALERVVHPQLRRMAPGLRQLLDPAAASTRRLEHDLYHLDQRVKGDGREMRSQVDPLRRRLRESLDAHLTAHCDLLEQLVATVPAQELDELVQRHAQALQRGPSRPHPHAPHTGVPQRVAFRVLSVTDRVVSALDSRIVPALPAPDQPA